jgi:hypothetical protein
MEIDNISNPLNQDTNAVKQVRRKTDPKSIAGKKSFTLECPKRWSYC